MPALQFFDAVGLVFWPVKGKDNPFRKPVSEMTYMYTVSGGTLNPTQLRSCYIQFSLGCPTFLLWTLRLPLRSLTSYSGVLHSQDVSQSFQSSFLNRDICIQISLDQSSFLMSSFLTVCPYDPEQSSCARVCVCVLVKIYGVSSDHSASETMALYKSVYYYYYYYYYM